MHEFDTYIGSIINSLKINKKKKDEMAQEFMDHLEMLKQDFIKEGYTEENAVNEAIRSFGNNMDLKLKLAQNINHHKTIPNILFGIFFTILIFRVGSYIPVSYITNDKIHLIILITTFISVFIPVGYFLPILFKGISSIHEIALVSLPLSLIMGIIISMSLGFVQTGFIAAIILGGLLGSILGVIILYTINKIVCKFRYSESIP